MILTSVLLNCLFARRVDLCQPVVWLEVATAPFSWRKIPEELEDAIRECYTQSLKKRAIKLSTVQRSALLDLGDAVGWQLTEADNGQKGLRCIRKYQGRPYRYGECSYRTICIGEDTTREEFEVLKLRHRFERMGGRP